MDRVYVKANSSNVLFCSKKSRYLSSCVQLDVMSGRVLYVLPPRSFYQAFLSTSNKGTEKKSPNLQGNSSTKKEALTFLPQHHICPEQTESLCCHNTPSYDFTLFNVRKWAASCLNSLFELFRIWFLSIYETKRSIYSTKCSLQMSSLNLAVVKLLYLQNME